MSDSSSTSSFQPSTDAPLLLTQPQPCEAGAGGRWLSQAWTLFKERPGLWIGMSLTMFLIMIVLSMIPGLNFVLSLGFGVIIAGFVIGAYELDENQNLQFAHLFAGFQRHVGQLLLLGVLYLVAIFVLILISAAVMLIFGGMSGGLGALMHGGMSGGLGALMHGDSSAWGAGMLLGVLLGCLVFLALIVPVAMAIWFAPALIALNGMSAIDAMKLSFKACWVNIIPFLVYGLVLIGLSLLALLTLGLGYIVLLPVIYISYYTSYREVLTVG